MVKIPSMIAVIKIIVFISISDCLNLPVFSSMNLKKKEKYFSLTRFCSKLMFYTELIFDTENISKQKNVETSH